MAHLKVRPFRSVYIRVFQQPLQLCRYVRVESWASAPEVTRNSFRRRGPSVAKAILNYSSLRHG